MKKQKRDRALRHLERQQRNSRYHQRKYNKAALQFIRAAGGERGDRR